MSDAETLPGHAELVEAVAAHAHTGCLQYSRPGHVFSAEHHDRHRARAKDLLRVLTAGGLLTVRDGVV